MKKNPFEFAMDLGYFIGEKLNSINHNNRKKVCQGVASKFRLSKKEVQKLTLGEKLEINIEQNLLKKNWK